MGQASILASTARLSGLQLAIMELLYSLSQSTGRRVKSGARYCFPSQQWLAGRLGVSRRSVNHAVRLLRLRGILDVIHRRKKDGWWQSNLYKVVDCRSWWRFWVCQVFNPTVNGEKKPSHIENPKKEILTSSEGSPFQGSICGVLADTIRDLEAKVPAFSLVK